MSFQFNYKIARLLYGKFKNVHLLEKEMRKTYQVFFENFRFQKINEENLKISHLSQSFTIE